MRKLSIRITIFVLLLTMLAATLAGCGGKEDPIPSTSVTSTPSSSDASNETPDEPTDEMLERNSVSLPLTEDGESFTLWIRNSEQFEGFVDFYDSEYFKHMEERTGVRMEFLHPVTGSETEHFNLLIAGENLPDFMNSFHSFYSLGIEHAIENDYVIPLNEYVNIMPDYYYYCTETDEVALQAVSDSGYLWGVHFISHVPQGAYRGLGIRQDWLDKSNLEKPTTIAEMERVLFDFKEKYTNGHGPLSLLSVGTSREGSLVGSYNVVGTNFMSSNGFLQKDGKVFFGPIEPGFKDYLTQMNDWWNKGLVFEEFTSNVTFFQTDQEDVVLDRVGIFDYTYTYSSTYKAVSEDPDFRVVALTTPRLNDEMEYSDIQVRLGQSKIRPENSIVITGACSDVELACKYWNYEFTDDGIILSNYGIEGLTFNYNANNEPEYTELFLETGGGNISYAQKKWLARDMGSFTIYTREVAPLDDDQKAAESIWGKVGAGYLISTNVSMTADENTEFSNRISDIRTLCEENIPQFIMGTKNLEGDYDQFIQNIYNLGIEKCIELKQAAVDRYYDRTWK
jgi:putative aldouronate transport system substrate-binding protein